MVCASPPPDCTGKKGEGLLRASQANRLLSRKAQAPILANPPNNGGLQVEVVPQLDSFGTIHLRVPIDEGARPILRAERSNQGKTTDARLIVGSSERMSEIEPGSLALTITSPPYWNAIDYDRHSQNPTASYRTRAYANGFKDYPSYLDWCSRIFSEVLARTKPGGFLAVVVGTVLKERAQYPVPFDLVARLSREGWAFHQEIIWHKTTAGVKRAGVFIQHPRPGYFHPNIMTEYILIFRKPGPPIYQRPHGVKAAANYRLDALFTKEVANNIWHIAPVPPRQLEHPCPFPEEIPYRLVQLFSNPGDAVLDPFLGSGQTSKVAFSLGRSVVGFDTMEPYVRYAFSRLDEPLSVRPMQLVAEFRKVPLDAPLGSLGRRTTPGKTRHGSGLSARGSQGGKLQSLPSE